MTARNITENDDVIENNNVFLQRRVVTWILLTGNSLYPLGILFQRSLKLVLCNAANPSEVRRQKGSEK